MLKDLLQSVLVDRRVEEIKIINACLVNGDLDTLFHYLEVTAYGGTLFSIDLPCINIDKEQYNNIRTSIFRIIDVLTMEGVRRRKQGCGLPVKYDHILDE